MADHLSDGQGSPVQTKAGISSGYRWRLGIIALVCLGFGVYCLYDGFYAYPRDNERYAMFERLQAEHPDTWRARWEVLAAEHGLPRDPGDLKQRSDFDIYSQYIMAALTLPVGLLFLFSYVRAGGRWIAADERGLQTSWGQHAPWDAITGIDKARWKSKGIAVVQYREPQPPHAERRLTLDDWKYERDPTVALVRAVEEKLGIADEEDDSGDDEHVEAEKAAS
jgi:hypothetical protein